MTRRSSTVSVYRIVAITAALLPLVAQPAAVADPILEIYDASLTKYKPSSATNEQGIQLLDEARGVHIDGALRVNGGVPMALAARSSGDPWNRNLMLSSVRLDLGTFVTTDVDLRLPAAGDYAFELSIDGNHVRSVPLFVRQHPAPGET